MNVLDEMLRNGEKVRSKERRDRVEIMAEILFAARKGATKTEMVYKANLNFKRVKSYLDYLEEKRLLENSDTLYTLTERGKELLHGYQRVKEILFS
jgi:predicted transcriptional regulator